MSNQSCVDPLDIVLPDDHGEAWCAQHIARCEVLLAQQRDEPSRYYYVQCIKGWQAELAKQQGATSPALNGDRI